MKSQKHVIVQQHELIVCKDKLLDSVQSAVANTVSETVQAEIKSYSEVVRTSAESAQTSKDALLASVQSVLTETVSESVQSGIKSYSEAVKSSSDTAQISQDTLKNVVKTAVQEGDRSKNVMMFGVPEGESEDLSLKVQEVFGVLGVKPSADVCRVGKTGNTARPRPVKVTLSCVTTARHVLVQARKLRDSDKLKTVFIRSDRTLEERAAHKLLIEEVKKKREEEPGKKHFIRGGIVLTEEKLAGSDA